MKINKVGKISYYQFSSQKEMLQFEKEREKYYLDEISSCKINSIVSFIKFYKLFFLEIFYPKYRNLKKLYGNYSGGYWINEKGYYCSDVIHRIDTSAVPDGAICLEINICETSPYIVKNKSFWRL